MCRIGRAAADPVAGSASPTGRRISSRNAGTPRYGALLICILTLPFGLRHPVADPVSVSGRPADAALHRGMIFLLLENHKGSQLHRSEHRNRQMAHHDLSPVCPTAP